MGIEFNNTASQNSTPEANDVAKTLFTAISNPNNTFNITIDKNSIQAISK